MPERKRRRLAAAMLALSLALLACLGAAGCESAATATQPEAAERQAAAPQQAQDAPASGSPATEAVVVPLDPADGSAADAAAAIADRSFLDQGNGYESAVEQPAADDDGEPSFTEAELDYAQQNPGYESYSPLDGAGRCGAATACLGPETMPADGEERGDISSVKPTGWEQAYYDSIAGEALWNRCHLIAWSLADENANERNLVTGTRSMNADGMLPYEEEVAGYIDGTGNHVLYRATPLFEGSEAVCRGVVLEARSLEDGGAGIAFAVLCVNAQPGVAIDYGTGESHAEGQPAPSEPRAFVLNTSSKKFHLPECESVGDMAKENRQDVTASRDELIEQGYEPCGSCRP